MNTNDNAAEKPVWFDGKFLNEVLFCEDFLSKHPMVRVGGSSFQHRRTNR